MDEKAPRGGGAMVTKRASADGDDDGGAEKGRIAALSRIKIRNHGAFPMSFWKGFPIAPNAAADGTGALVS